jgi:hypothetical protein
MGRIPNFQNTIFPKESLPFINLIATLGLVFFLFQVGLEVDLRIIKKKWQQSVSIAVVGMAFPFGLGAAVSVGLYKLENEGNVPFSSFVLFLGVAMAITVSYLVKISLLFFFCSCGFQLGIPCVGSYLGRTQVVKNKSGCNYNGSGFIKRLYCMVRGNIFLIN